MTVAMLLAAAVEEAARARTLFPQPNNTTLALAEEAGEVVKAALDFRQGKSTRHDLRKELKQTIAMCLRLAEEGDPTIGVPPCIDAALAASGERSPRAGTADDEPTCVECGCPAGAHFGTPDGAESCCRGRDGMGCDCPHYCAPPPRSSGTTARVVPCTACDSSGDTRTGGDCVVCDGCGEVFSRAPVAGAVSGQGGET